MFIKIATHILKQNIDKNFEVINLESFSTFSFTNDLLKKNLHKILRL